MEPRSGVEYRVGIFMVVAIILALGFILMLGGDKAIFQRTYNLRMQADDTGGVETGSVVQIAGVQCGHVKSITFDTESNKINIDLNIEHKYAKRITKGSTAGLHTQGALGDRFILIKPGPMGAEPLAENAFLEAEADSDIFSTLSKSGNRVGKVFDILDGVEKLVQSLNDKNFAVNMSETARNMKNATSSLEDVLASIRGSDPKANKIKKAMDHLSSILEKIDNGQGTIGGLINDPTVHEDLKSIVGGAKRSKILKYLIKQAIKNSDEDENAEKPQKK